MKRNEPAAALKFRLIFLTRHMMGLISALFLLSICYVEPTIIREKETQIHSDCLKCHMSLTPEKDAGMFHEGKEPSSLCFQCHGYAANHHPVDFVPVWPYSNRGTENYPRFDGEIKCLTCHMVHGGPGLTSTPKLLRNGPHEDRRESCRECHDQGKFALENPHVAGIESYDPRSFEGDPACLVCHTIIPDPELDNLDDVTFKADIAFLCWRCHPPMSGLFFDQHFLVKPSEQFLEMIKITENEQNVIIPLVPRGRITCSTCHYPHAEETIVSGPTKTGTNRKYMLRLNNICLACHKMSPSGESVEMQHRSTCFH